MFQTRAEYDTLKSYFAERVGIIVRAAEARQAVSKPVRILDIATGGNGFNPLFLKELSIKGIDYEFVISDITVEISTRLGDTDRNFRFVSGGGFMRGYHDIEKSLPESEMRRIIPVFADARNLREELQDINVNRGKGREQIPLEKVLANPDYSFILNGYDGTKRKISFENESFDIVTGVIPFGSTGCHIQEEVVNETVRVLEKGGSLIVEEDMITKLNYLERVSLLARKILENPAKAPELIKWAIRATQHAKKGYLGDLEARLNKVLSFQEAIEYTDTYKNREEDISQVIQFGDQRRNVVLVYRKE
jgi:hypothetical protein